MLMPNEKPEPQGTGVDRTVIRQLLQLTPAERFRRAVEEARNMAALDEKLRRAR